jgi:glycosyltransferase involved in cell wall biosynthesis
MLRRPVPWLVRRVPAFARRANRLRAQLAARIVRVQFGNAVFPANELARQFERAAASRWVGLRMLEAIVAANVGAHGSAAVTAAARDALDVIDRSDDRRRSRLFVATLRALAAGSNAAATAFGDAAVDGIADPAAAVALATCHERSGAVVRPAALLSRLSTRNRPSRLARRLEAEARLLDEGGVTFGGRAERSWLPATRRILYFASQSLPHHSSGYAIRTHWLIRNLKAKDWDVSVCLRQGYPNDRYDFLGVADVPRAAEIDGVAYRFSPDRRHGIGLDLASYQAHAVATLTRQVAQLRPALIHSASNFSCGLAGSEVAHRLGLPAIYEVRGLWHLTRASKQPEYHGSDHFRLITALEAQAARTASHTFAITQAVKDVLVDHGVPADRISILPNAVDTSHFVARDRDRALEQRWRLEGKAVIGYIGSFKDYEGLDYLLDAAARLRTRIGDGFRILLVGDGSEYDALRAQRERLRLGDVVALTGRISHDAIPAYYSVMDVLAFPRKGLPVCEVVSPLKPFEAMAMGKLVVASNVAALAEIVEHGVTGLLHRKDDVSDLCDQLATALAQPAHRAALARRGQDWVREHRSWATITGRIDAVYRELTARADPR